jgi:hypothetical protein
MLARSRPPGACRYHRGAGHPGCGGLGLSHSQLAAHQRVRQQPGLLHHQRGSQYLEINLSGSWSPLTFGASGLPAGGSYRDTIFIFADSGILTSTGPPPIPPGSSNETGPFTANSTTFGEAHAVTAIPAGLQQGSTFNITLWASDGTTKQTESVPIVIKTTCKRHY